MTVCGIIETLKAIWKLQCEDYLEGPLLAEISRWG